MFRLFGYILKQDVVDCRWSTELLPVLEGDDWALDMLELQLGSPAFAKVSG